MRFWTARESSPLWIPWETKNAWGILRSLDYRKVETVRCWNRASGKDVAWVFGPYPERRFLGAFQRTLVFLITFEMFESIWRAGEMQLLRIIKNENRKLMMSFFSNKGTKHKDFPEAPIPERLTLCALVALCEIWKRLIRHRQHLDRNLAAELGIRGTIHLTHAALPELGGDLVMGNVGAEHGGTMEGIRWGKQASENKFNFPFQLPTFSNGWDMFGKPLS